MRVQSRNWKQPTRVPYGNCKCFSVLFFFHVVDAYETSKMLCEQYYLTSPDMQITELNCESSKTTSMFLFAVIFLSVCIDFHYCYSSLYCTSVVQHEYYFLQTYCFIGGVLKFNRDLQDSSLFGLNEALHACFPSAGPDKLQLFLASFVLHLLNNSSSRCLLTDVKTVLSHSRANV